MADLMYKVAYIDDGFKEIFFPTYDKAVEYARIFNAIAGEEVYFVYKSRYLISSRTEDTSKYE